MSESDSNSGSALPAQMLEVRYCLKDLLKEVEQERAISGSGREMVDQSEIQSMFKKRKRKRARKS